MEARLDLNYISSNVEKSNAILNQRLLNLNIEKEVAARRAQVLREYR